MSVGTVPIDIKTVPISIKTGLSRIADSTVPYAFIFALDPQSLKYILTEFRLKLLLCPVDPDAGNRKALIYNIMKEPSL